MCRRVQVPFSNCQRGFVFHCYFFVMTLGDIKLLPGRCLSASSNHYKKGPGPDFLSTLHCPSYIYTICADLYTCWMYTALICLTVASFLIAPAFFSFRKTIHHHYNVSLSLSLGESRKKKNVWPIRIHHLTKAGSDQRQQQQQYNNFLLLVLAAVLAIVKRCTTCCLHGGSVMYIIMRRIVGRRPPVALFAQQRDVCL